MSMTGDGMAGAIVAAMDNAGLFTTPSGGEAEHDQSRALALENFKVMSGAMVLYIQENMEVTTKLTTGFSDVIGAGIPVPQDGGATLQAGQLSAISGNPSVDEATGTVE